MVEPRWLFVCCNGFGLGHLSRMIGLARNLRRLQPRGRILFLTSSEAIQLLWREDFPSVKIPSSQVRRKKSDRTLDLKFIDTISQSVVISVLKSYRPDTVVVDTYPWGQRNELAPIKDYRGRKILVYREDGEINWNPRFEAAIRSYHHILVPLPRETRLFLPPDTAVTWTGPILVRSRTDALPRNEARARLGLPADGQTCLVSLGGGGDPNWKKVLDWIVPLFSRSPGWTFALPHPPLSAALAPANLPDNGLSFAYFPIAECYAAFDAAITVTGNSVFELAYFGVPSIIVPKTWLKGTEDHQAKAENIAAEGRGFVVPVGDSEGLLSALKELGSAGRRAAISQALVKTHGTVDAAAQAAEHLLEWTSRPLTPSPRKGEE